MKYPKVRRRKRKINKLIRQFNSSLVSDPLFPNRFLVRENRYWFNPYYDEPSDGTIVMEIEVKDKLTGSFGHFIVNQYDYRREIFDYINDFIIRCRSGTPGHYPILNWYRLDIKEVKS